MRVLTVKQPWADLIMAGVKDVENRTWPVPSTLPQQYRCYFCGEYEDAHGTIECQSPGWAAVGPFPFRLSIHAAKTWDRHILRRPTAHCYTEHVGTGRRFPSADDVTFGALLGYVTVTGCHHAIGCLKSRTWGGYCSRWAQAGAYHWTLADPEPLAVPVPMKGRLGLWTTDLPVSA